ncbi:MAG: hypothetical protein ABI823_11935, partial [Bryobacteraceae bacterium]
NLFGLVFFPDEGTITHTSATAIIGRDGRLKAILEGSSYTAPQLKDLIGTALANPASSNPPPRRTNE